MKEVEKAQEKLRKDLEKFREQKAWKREKELKKTIRDEAKWQKMAVAAAIRAQKAIVMALCQATGCAARACIVPVVIDKSKEGGNEVGVPVQAESSHAQHGARVGTATATAPAEAGILQLSETLHEHEEGNGEQEEHSQVVETPPPTCPRPKPHPIQWPNVAQSEGSEPLRRSSRYAGMPPK